MEQIVNVFGESLNALVSSGVTAVFALIALAVAGFVVRGVKRLAYRVAGKIDVDGRLSRVAQGDVAVTKPVVEVSGVVLWVLAASAILDYLGVTQASAVLAELFGGIIGALPAIIAASISLYIVWAVIKVAKPQALRGLESLGINRLGELFGLEQPLNVARFIVEYVTLNAMLLAGVSAAETVGWAMVAGLLSTAMAFLGNLAVGIALFAGGMAIATLGRTWLGKVNSMVAQIVYYAVVLMSSLVLIESAGVDPSLITGYAYIMPVILVFVGFFAAREIGPEVGKRLTKAFDEAS